MSITHNENLNPSLNLLINCISAISVPQILSNKDYCTFLLLNFLIIGLCNSSANYRVHSETLATGATGAKYKRPLFEVFSF